MLLVIQKTHKHSGLNFIFGVKTKEKMLILKILKRKKPVVNDV